MNTISEIEHQFRTKYQKTIERGHWNLPVVVHLREKHAEYIKICYTYDELVDFAFQILKERFEYNYYQPESFTEYASVDHYTESHYGRSIEAIKEFAESLTSQQLQDSINRWLESAESNFKILKSDIKFHKIAKSVVTGELPKVHAIELLQSRDQYEYEYVKFSGSRVGNKFFL